MIAIDIDKRHKGKEVKRNTISHVLKYFTYLGGWWQPQRAQREKMPQYPKLRALC